MVFKNIKAIAAPAMAVASCGQLIINITVFEIPFKTEFAKTIPTDQIKINLIIAARIAPVQKFFLPNLEKIRTNKAFPAIINGIIGAKAKGKRPVYMEIRLGIKHNKKADSTPIKLTEIKSRALTIDPVIN